MAHKIPARSGKITPLPRARAHLAKAMALTMLATSLAAHGHSPDPVKATVASPVTLAYDAKQVLGDANVPPVAVTDYVDLQNAGQAFNVLANDLDANQDTLTVIEAHAQFGAVAYTSDGLVAYAANSTQSRQADKINYVVSDGRGGRANGTVIVSFR